VLVDLGLPDSFGLQTFHRIHDAVGAATPVVVLSGSIDDALATAAVASGAQDFLRKHEMNAAVLSRTLRYAIERHRLQREVERADRLASIGRLAATMAHEFNNILMGISPWAQIIAASAKGDRRLESAAGHIVESVRRGKSVTFQVLDYAKPRVPRKQPLELGAWLAGLLDELKPTLRCADGLVLQELPARQIHVAADPDQLAQVVSNLVRNADEATDCGTPIAVELRLRNERAEISVSDQGPGVAAADRKKIFEPLYSTKRRGTGLGLTVAFETLKAHGGTISVEANQPRGSKFVVCLPVTDDAAADGREGELACPPWVRRVLLVDDEEAAAEGVRQLLLEHVQEVRVALTGAEALDLVADMRPDFVILDIGLPDMNGIDVLRQMPSPHPPVVFATGHVQRADVEPLLGDRIGHVTKPYALEDIWRAVAGFELKIEN
jgi:signal transduction histidine kinase